MNFDIGFSGTVDLPFVEGLPSVERTVAMKRWIKSNSNQYANVHVVMYHATGSDVPVESEGLLPTSQTRRRSYQSTSGYVYLAATPERAANFGRLGNGGRCTVYAVAVPIRKLKPDLDQLRNLESVGRGAGGMTLADSICHSGCARIKGRVAPWAIRRI